MPVPTGACAPIASIIVGLEMVPASLDPMQ